MSILKKYKDRINRTFVKRSARVNALNLMDFDQDRKTINLSWDKTVLDFKEVGEAWLFIGKGRGKETILYFPNRESYIPLGVIIKKSVDEIIELIKQNKSTMLTLLKSNSDIDYTGEVISLDDGFELKVARRIKSKVYDIDFLKDGKKYHTEDEVFLSGTLEESQMINQFRNRDYKVLYENYLKDIETLKNNREKLEQRKVHELKYLTHEGLDFIETLDKKQQTKAKNFLMKPTREDGVEYSIATWVIAKISDGWQPKLKEWTQYNKKIDRDVKKSSWYLVKDETSYPIKKTEASFAEYLLRSKVSIDSIDYKEKLKSLKDRRQGDKYITRLASDLNVRLEIKKDNHLTIYKYNREKDFSPEELLFEGNLTDTTFWLQNQVKEKYENLVTLDSIQTVSLETLKDLKSLDPTEKQKESGNYKKHKIKLKNRLITIENIAGSIRSNVNSDGKRWTTKMKDHYGYFNNTLGADGDHIDVFVNSEAKAHEIEDRKAFVVVQNDIMTHEFDEHKLVLGSTSTAHAKEIYLRNYDDDFEGFGSVFEIEDLSEWLDNESEKNGKN